MTKPTLLIGNKVYSSWSMRPWILMTELAIPFEEKVIRLRQADTGSRIREHAGSGKVPVVIDGDVTVWESIAICEYLAERYPDRGVWPKRKLSRSDANGESPRERFTVGGRHSAAHCLHSPLEDLADRCQPGDWPEPIANPIDCDCLSRFGRSHR